MSSFTRHVILNHVDSPLKILIWTKGELALFILPALTGMLMGHIILGFILSIVNYKLFGIYKRRFGKGQLQAVLYWFFPHMSKRFPAFPASYIREYQG